MRYHLLIRQSHSLLNDKNQPWLVKGTGGSSELVHPPPGQFMFASLYELNSVAAKVLI